MGNDPWGCLMVVGILAAVLLGLVLIMAGLDDNETSHYVHSESERDALNGIADTWDEETADKARSRANLRYTTSSGPRYGMALAGVAIEFAIVAVFVWQKEREKKKNQ